MTTFRVSLVSGTTPKMSTSMFRESVLKRRQTRPTLEVIFLGPEFSKGSTLSTGPLRGERITLLSPNGVDESSVSDDVQRRPKQTKRTLRALSITKGRRETYRETRWIGERSTGL